MTSRGLHISIGASPQSALTGGGTVFSVSLEHDLRLVKASILYGDGVRLCSPAASLVLTALSMGTLTFPQQLELFASWAPVIRPDSAASVLAGISCYKVLSRKRYRTRDELLFMRKFKSLFAAQWRELEALLDTMVDETGADALIRALKSGLVELHPLQFEDTEAIATAFFEAVSTAVTDGMTYPLFDRETGELVRLGIEEGKVTVTQGGVTRGKISGLAADFLRRLPRFDCATVDEILQIRQELSRPLVGFRAEVMDFSEKVATAAWDADFPFEADLTFRRKVEPAVLALEEAVRSNRYLAELMSRPFGRTATSAGGGVISLLVAQALSLPDIVAASFAVGSTVAAALWDGHRDWRQKQQQIEENRLFFYYAAGTHLGKGSCTT